jgi:O-antigen ligase
MRRTNGMQMAIMEIVYTSSALFLLTGVVGVWAAPELATAWPRFGLLAAGVVLLFGAAWAGRQHTRHVLSLIGLLGGALGALLAIGYAEGFLTNSGMVASAILPLLPLGAGGLLWSRLERWRWGVRVGVATLLLALAGFAACRERTAWLALATGGGCAAWVYWRLGEERPHLLHHLVDLLLVLAVITLLTLYGVLLFTPLLDGYVSATPLVNALLERLPLWRESIVLIGDYRFTGSGLNNSAMIYSTYAYLLHVPVFYHAHNLYLQIALEQGLPGLIAFLGIALTLLTALLTTYHKASAQSRIFYLATITALIAVLAYGLFDAELYASPLAPLLFLPFGFAFSLYRAYHRRRQASHQPTTAAIMPVRGGFSGAGLLPIAALLLIFLWPGALAGMQANLGALAQSKAELGRFHWPESPLQDELRRNNEVDLSQAISQYNSALAFDPNNGTAHRRLGQIALSRGDFQSAQEHLAQALAIEPQIRATRQLLGEVYAVTGHPDQAAALWQGISVQQGQLEVRHWWYEHIGAIHEANLITQAVEKLK